MDLRHLHKYTVYPFISLKFAFSKAIPITVTSTMWYLISAIIFSFGYQDYIPREIWIILDKDTFLFSESQVEEHDFIPHLQNSRASITDLLNYTATTLTPPALKITVCNESQYWQDCVACRQKLSTTVLHKILLLLLFKITNSIQIIIYLKWIGSSNLLHLNHDYYHFAWWSWFDGKDEESQMYYLEKSSRILWGKKRV